MQRIVEAYARSVFEITPSFIIVTFPYASDFEREDETKIGVIDSAARIDDGNSGIEKGIESTVNGTVGVYTGVNNANGTVGVNAGVNGINDANSVNFGVNGVNGVNRSVVLSLMKKEPFITLKDLSLKTDIPRRTLDRIVSELKNENAIVRIGTKRSGYWKILE